MERGVKGITASVSRARLLTFKALLDILVARVKAAWTVLAVK
jgi:hypothetical protein